MDQKYIAAFAQRLLNENHKLIDSSEYIKLQSAKEAFVSLNPGETNLAVVVSFNDAMAAFQKAIKVAGGTV